MKKNFFLLIACLVSLLIGSVNSCKKDTSSATHIGTTTSFTEEFDNVNGLSSKGWVLTENSSGGLITGYAAWAQGYHGYDKAGVWSGFAAYSYTATQDEFAYSLASSSATTYSISSWMISPVLSVKNGDKISFYTRGDTTGTYTDRLQVRINKSASSDVGTTLSSVGDFTNVIIDINPAQASGGYPTTWTKYEYTFSGISGNMDTRVAFRHYFSNASNAKGVGIDQFKFQVN